jgi:hypothetical protein
MDDRGGIGYWQVAGQRVAALALVAIRYYVRPVSSAAVESFFSKCTYIDNPRRSGLTGEHLDMLSWLMANQRFAIDAVASAVADWIGFSPRRSLAHRSARCARLRRATMPTRHPPATWTVKSKAQGGPGRAWTVQVGPQGRWHCEGQLNGLLAEKASRHPGMIRTDVVYLWRVSRHSASAFESVRRFVMDFALLREFRPRKTG